MDIQMVRRGAFAVAGLNRHGKAGGEDLARLWGTFGPRMGELQDVVNPQVCYGVIHDWNMDTGEFDYLAACEVSSRMGLPNDMICVDVPEATYAVVACTLPGIREGYEHVYQEWMPAAGYQRAAGPEFELYDEAFDPADPSSQLYVYIPVEPSATAQH